MSKIDKKYILQNAVHIFTSETGILTLCHACQNYSASLRKTTGENIEFYVDANFTSLYANNISELQAEFYTGLCNGYLLAKTIWGEG